MIDAEMQIRNVLALPDETFQTLVEKNLGREDQPQLWAVLLHPHVVRRTHEVLSTRFRDVEDQLALRSADMKAFQQECHAMPDAEEGKAAWFDAVGEHEEWRRRAIGYRRLLSARLSEAKQVLRKGTPPPQPPNPARRVRLMETVFKLAWAIGEHRTQTIGQGLVPDAHDVALWRALDHIQVETLDGPIPVAKFLADITSQDGFTPPVIELAEPDLEEEVA